MRKILGLLTLSLLLFTACKQEPEVTQTETPVVTDTVLIPNLTAIQLQGPAERWGELFEAVQTSHIFPDSKTFVDCIPKRETASILADFNSKKDLEGFEIKAFVDANFDLPPSYGTEFQSNNQRPIEDHINALWPVLTRQPDASGGGTLLPLPYPYIVPGGRFREIYYWDSYFTMLGLQVADRTEDIENMVKNFAYIIDQVGFIPNGNRSYYLTRSQPPFFSLMLGILAEQKGDDVIRTYQAQLEKEYAFWMEGIENMGEEFSNDFKHLVRMPNGAILNRYYDAGDYPREESYIEDIETAEAAKGKDIKVVYRDLRAGAASGWDYSSRWFADGKNMSTIHTTDIIPVDLNALLYNLENTLSKAAYLSGDQEAANLYSQKAQNRKDAILAYCWDADSGFFRDYDFKQEAITDVPSLAGVYPLFFALATEAQAAAVAEVIERDFLKPGGVVSTLNNTGQQWDFPNGWAPLQWMTIKGLRNYNQNDLADTISQRWINLNQRVYQNTAKLVEKYNVVDMSLDAGGGEYPTQDGFGWTNGVLLRLLSDQ